jgi:UDP-glucuronate 4-epimerase
MVLFKFTKAILEGRPIDVFNQGYMKRDFTYIDDVIESVTRVMDIIPGPDPTWASDAPDPSSSLAPFRLYNIGNSEPVALLDVIQWLEEALGRKAKVNLLPMQPGDVPATYANVESLEEVTGFRPKTPMKEGIRRFVDWFRTFYA